MAKFEGKKFIVPTATPMELEEDLRSVCVYHYYPRKIYDYLMCRQKDILSSWWDNCLISNEIPPSKIKKCASSSEAQTLLRKNISLGENLGISTGPYILLENQEIFGINDKTSIEELESLIKLRERRK